MWCDFVPSLSCKLFSSSPLTPLTSSSPSRSLKSRFTRVVVPACSLGLTQGARLFLWIDPRKIGGFLQDCRRLSCWSWSKWWCWASGCARGFQFPLCMVCSLFLRFWEVTDHSTEYFRGPTEPRRPCLHFHHHRWQPYPYTPLAPLVAWFRKWRGLVACSSFKKGIGDVASWGFRSRGVPHEKYSAGSVNVSTSCWLRFTTSLIKDYKI